MHHDERRRSSVIGGDQLGPVFVVSLESDRGLGLPQRLSVAVCRYLPIPEYHFLSGPLIADQNVGDRVPPNVPRKPLLCKGFALGSRAEASGRTLTSGHVFDRECLHFSEMSFHRRARARRARELWRRSTVRRIRSHFPPRPLWVREVVAPDPPTKQTYSRLADARSTSGSDPLVLERYWCHFEDLNGEVPSSLAQVGVTVG